MEKKRENDRGIRGYIRKLACILTGAVAICCVALFLAAIIAGPARNEPEEASYGGAAADVVAKPSDSRQVIVSMGEKYGEVFISWKGDEKGPGCIRYSKDRYSLPVTEPVIGQRCRVLSDDVYRYKVRLTNLESGENYYYEIGDGTVYDDPRFFSTPDNDGEDVFAYLGDPQFDRSTDDYEDWGDLVWDMYDRAPDTEFVVTGGDMVNLPTREDHWNGFLDNCRLFSMIPMATIPGNHEGITSNNTYRALFHHVDNGPADEAFYWFESETCRFVMMDSSFLTKARRAAMGQALWSVREQEVKKWLRKTLRESRKPWNIVVVHHPVYGLHDFFTVSPEIRESWLPIMKEEGVDLVLCGHQHVYMRTQRMDGITHIMGVSGSKRSNYYKGFNEPMYSRSIYASGSNYQIFRATPERLEIKSYNEKGDIIDAAHIDKNIRLPYFQTF